jgi:hypothetical protein
VGKAFGSGEGKMKSGTRREVELGLTAFVHNFELKHEDYLNNI